MTTSSLFELLQSRLCVRSGLVSGFAENGYLKFRDLLASVPRLKNAHEQLSRKRGKVTKFPKLSFGRTFERPDPAERSAHERAFCSAAWHSELAQMPCADGIRRVLARLTETPSLHFEPRWLHEQLLMNAEQIAAEIAAAGHSAIAVARAIGLDLRAHRGKHPAASAWHDPEHFVRACICLIRSISSQERRRGRPHIAKSKWRHRDDDSATG